MTNIGCARSRRSILQTLISSTACLFSASCVLDRSASRDSNQAENTIPNKPAVVQGLPSGAKIIDPTTKSKTVKQYEPSPNSEIEVTPNEDLMREHGVLRRILIIYEDFALRLDHSQFAPIDALARSATMIRQFIENYHERLEEDLIFPIFEKAKIEYELTNALRAQHNCGRALTTRIQELTTHSQGLGPLDRAELSGKLRAFCRMYRPHAAKEDTIIFASLPRIITKDAYLALGEKMEDRERQLFGEYGFENMVQEVGALEQRLGLYDLDQFSPKGCL